MDKKKVRVFSRGKDLRTGRRRENSCSSLHAIGGLCVSLRVFLCFEEVKYGSHKYSVVMAITHW